MKRLVSFKKLKISSGLAFLRRSFKLLVWLYFGQGFQNLSQFMIMCLTQRDTFYVEHIVFLFRRCEWVMWL